MIQGTQIIDTARAWVGRPFQHQGRTEMGVDCIGLVLCVRSSLGAWNEVRRYKANYRRDPQAALEVGIARHLTQIERPELGCVALIRWPKQRYAAHVAFLTPGNIIHAYERVGRVIETSYGQPWLRWTVSLWRLPGVTP